MWGGKSIGEVITKTGMRWTHNMVYSVYSQWTRKRCTWNLKLPTKTGWTNWPLCACLPIPFASFRFLDHTGTGIAEKISANASWRLPTAYTFPIDRGGDWGFGLFQRWKPSGFNMSEIHSRWYPASKALWRPCIKWGWEVPRMERTFTLFPR